MRNNWLKAGDVLKSVLDNKGLSEGIRRHAAVLGWEDAVGKRIAEKARPLSLSAKTLFVQVDGSSWIHELTFMKADILRKLNERAGGEADAIDQIVFMAKGHGGRGVAPRTGRDNRNE